MSVSMLCLVSVDPQLRGHSVLYGMGRDQRYYHENYIDLQNRGILRNLSSAIVWESHSIDATLILFDNHDFLWPVFNYRGNFLQLTNIRDSGSELRLDRFSDYGFNNQPASLIEVNSRSILRYSFRDLFLSEWRANIDDALGSDASRRGDPVMTWEMWPQGISHLDPELRYLKIHQPLNINIDWWPDYDASITYHIYLYLSNGRLRGHCARWAYWIEGGMKTGSIRDRLRPAVIDGCTILTNVLNEKLREYEDIQFSALYYLPGRQLTWPPPSILTGNTLDDVTIVLEV
jgi:hypothetical protein